MEEARLDIMSRVKNARVLSAIAEGEVVGIAFMGFLENAAMIHAMAVAPQMRRRGLAHRILRAADGLNPDFITMLVTRENNGARELYYKAGYAEITRYHSRSI